MNPADPPLTSAPPSESALDAGLAAAFGDSGTTSYASFEPEPGTILAGKYRLSERIGEGGMGSVWVAHQSEPVKRKVAVKLIKAGMDSKQVLARFEAERQALAVMDHPNIAKVLDGGLASPAGHGGGSQPFFVMELVKGVPITQYCDANKLTPKQRLELFVPVCQAIQHAHQKGIIHRDIKPSNVLIALYDDRPVPKVIDFGVAKATGGTLTEQTIETAFGGVVGTPQYMSPEQASLNNLDIDTRSDVYSLGVLLYELLTGSPPFARKELQKAGLLEILRVVREEEPPRPSTKLSTADALPSLAANRGTEPKKLTGLLRNELDWIVMKALEKDRTRRYETANGFAADVNRYLTGEAVQAHPPSAGYRLKKFVQKNRGPVVAGSLVFLALLAGLVATSIALQDAEYERARANAAEKSATDHALAATDAADAERKAKEEEIKQREKAEKAYARTVDVLDAMVSEITGDSLATQKTITPEQKKFLTEVLTYYKEFAAVRGEDEQTRARTANAAIRVGKIEERLGRKEEGAAAVERARDEYAKLVTEFPTVAVYRFGLARSHNNLGVLLADMGRRAEAEVQYRKGLTLRKEMAAKFPLVPLHRAELARTHANLRNLLAIQGKVAEAEVEHREALALQQALADEYPAVPEYRHSLAQSHRFMGAQLEGRRKEAEAEVEYRKALALWQALADEYSAVPEYRHGLAGSHALLGALVARQGKGAEAVGLIRKGLAIWEILVVEYPAVPVYRRDLADHHHNLGIMLASLGRRDEARREYETARDLWKNLVDTYPTISKYQVSLGGSYCNLGNLVLDEGKPAESLPWFGKAIDTLRSVHMAEPHDFTTKRFLCNSHLGQALAFYRLKKFVEAAQDMDQVVELSEAQERLKFRLPRATTKLFAGQVSEAVAEVTELRKLARWTAGHQYEFARVYSVASGKIADKKAEYAATAMELLAKAVKAGYKDAAHMKKDTDFDPLRERDDFKKLLAELEAKANSKE